MDDLRKAIGTTFCKPLGQVVLLEVVTYISEASLAITGKETASAFSYYRVAGYGGLTIECNVGDIVDLINVEDIRFKTFGFPTEINNLKIKLFETRDDLVKVSLQGSIKDVVRNAMDNNNFNSWQDLLNAKRYVKGIAYALIQEHNIEFVTSTDTIQYKLQKFFAKEKISIENLTAIKDELITDEFINQYKLLNTI